jgi:hypothetical protein
LRTLFFIGLLASCVVPSCSGADVETWSNAEAEVLAGSRLNLVIQGQFRTRHNLGDYYQTRLGPILKVRLTPRLYLTGGYYFRDSENSKGIWKASHRPFGGAEMMVRDGKLKISTRVMVERFINDTVPDYCRFREWVRFSGRGRISPYGLMEAFQTPRGSAFLRGQGGVQWRFHPWMSMELGCLHDSSHKWYGPNRTAFLTSLRFHLDRRD